MTQPLHANVYIEVYPSGNWRVSVEGTIPEPMWATADAAHALMCARMAAMPLPLLAKGRMRELLTWAADLLFRAFEDYPLVLVTCDFQPRLANG